MMIIGYGWIEIYTLNECNEFIIERLTTGDIIHPRLFLLEDNAQINFRCLTNCKIYLLSADNFNYIKNND